MTEGPLVSFTFYTKSEKLPFKKDSQKVGLIWILSLDDLNEHT